MEWELTCGPGGTYRDVWDISCQFCASSWQSLDQNKQSLVRLRENCLGGKCKILEDLFLCLGPSKANMSSPLPVAYSVCVSRKVPHILNEVRLVYSIMNQFLPYKKKFCTIYKNSWTSLQYIYIMFMYLDYIYQRAQSLQTFSLLQPLSYFGAT